jgi:hypothetical protein
MRCRGKVRKAALAGLMVLALGACESMGPEEKGGPGFLTATLHSPKGAEGSAVFQLEDGVDLGLVSASGGEVFYQHAGASSRVVVVLDEPGEVQFQVHTGDRSEPPRVTVLQVADESDDLRPSLDGYTVDLTSVKGSASGALGALGPSGPSGASGVRP